MSQHHKWSVTEIEDLIPYERDIYVEMLIAFLRDADNKNTSSDGISMEDIWKSVTKAVTKSSRCGCSKLK